VFGPNGRSLRCLPEEKSRIDMMKKGTRRRRKKSPRPAGCVNSKYLPVLRGRKESGEWKVSGQGRGVSGVEEVLLARQWE